MKKNKSQLGKRISVVYYCAQNLRTFMFAPKMAPYHLWYRGMFIKIYRMSQITKLNHVSDHNQVSKLHLTNLKKLKYFFLHVSSNRVRIGSK